MTTFQNINSLTACPACVLAGIGKAGCGACGGTGNLSAIRRLECCCCAVSTRGRQWWNRDTGYGLCARCATSIGKRESRAEMESLYGFEGIHYNCTAGAALPEVRV